MARTVVGLDIGSSGVRAAEFSLGRRTTLRKFATVPLPEGVIRSGMVADADALSEALRELWSVGKFSTKTVLLGIANDAVLVRQMDLEWMPPGDFRKGLRYQVADALARPRRRGQPRLLHARRDRTPRRGRRGPAQGRPGDARRRRPRDGRHVRAGRAGRRPPGRERRPAPVRARAGRPRGRPGGAGHRRPAGGGRRHRRRHGRRRRAPGRSAAVRAHPSRPRRPGDHPRPDGALRVDLGGGRAHQDRARPARTHAAGPVRRRRAARCRRGPPGPRGGRRAGRRPGHRAARHARLLPHVHRWG